MIRFLHHTYRLSWPALCLLILTMAGSPARAQAETGPFPQVTELQQGPPLTNQEFVTLLYQLPKHPDERAKLIDEVRKRGIGFPFTEGLRSLVATKSGNNSDLRHALEEAERRRVNPTAVTAKVPPPADAAELLERTRKATLGATGTMPDYLVRQQITRSYAQGETRNWNVYDRLSLAVSFRESQGEQYKLLSVNGMPATDETEGSRYGRNLGGSTSTGEFVSRLVDLFRSETRAEIQPVDTDQVRDRNVVVFEYVVKREFSHQALTWADRPGGSETTVVVGYHGRIWVDRENNRVLRLENISDEIPSGFPITAASSVIDYDWVSINENSHLLPIRALVELSTRVGQRSEQTRNDILFRGYRKFGTEVKITDVDEKDFPPDPPEPNENRATTPPVLKPAPKKP